MPVNFLFRYSLNTLMILMRPQVFDHLSYTSFSGFDAHETTPFKKTYLSKIPKQMEDNYYEKQAVKYDPVVKYTFSTMEPLWLSDAVSLPFFQHKEHKNFIEYGQHVVSDGLCIPITGPNFLKGYIFAAYEMGKPQSDWRFRKNDILNWHLIGLSNLFHTRYCKLRASMQIKVQLTKRELDVLQCVVSGKTNREIGTILGISTNTVNSYLKNIFLKMNTTDRVTTALKAYSLNLISSPPDIPPANYIEEA